MKVKGNRIAEESMDKIECYLAGTIISSGYITDNSDIICEFDEFEQVDHMFQTSLNSICAECDNQLATARKIISAKK